MALVLQAVAIRGGPEDHIQRIQCIRRAVRVLHANQCNKNVYALNAQAKK